MNNKLLLIASVSFVLLALGQVKSAEYSQKGGMILDHSPHHYQRNVFQSPLHKDSSDEEKKMISENFIDKITRQYTSDPDELDEISTQKFNKNKFGEAAKILIAAAVYGHVDIQGLLYDIDPTSAQYFELDDPLSFDAIKYYESLSPKVENYLSKKKMSPKKEIKKIEFPGKKDFTFGDYK
jgi:hypothetical protein